MAERPAIARLVIATRRSRLALWQAEHVKARLEAAHPGLAVELLALSTRGDELLEVSLAKEGGKGLFIKELEAALAEARQLELVDLRLDETRLALVVTGAQCGFVHLRVGGEVGRVEFDEFDRDLLLGEEFVLMCLIPGLQLVVGGRRVVGRRDHIEQLQVANLLIEPQEGVDFAAVDQRRRFHPQRHRAQHKVATHQGVEPARRHAL